MSDNYWEAWWYGGSAYDRRTRREMDERDASQARARSRLASQMASRQGDLQAQIDRLTQAFVALVEYEDVRGELNEHADAAACRKYAREVLPTLLSTGGAGLDSIQSVAVVPGYWLAAVTRGLVRTATGGDGSADLALAQQWDPGRTSTLLVLIDAIRRELRFSDGHIETVLPSSPDLTAAHRQIWIAIAAGRLDASAQALLEDRLAQLMGDGRGDVCAAWVRALTPEGREIAPNVRAATTLEALRRLIDPDSSLHSASRGPGDDEQQQPPASEDPLADVLRTLVDEGAPGEAEILNRMSAVRATMGFVDERGSADLRWDDPAGSVLDLLLVDLGDREGSGRRDLAVRLLAPDLLSVVEQLDDEANTRSALREVTIAERSIPVGPDGPADPAWRTAAESRIRPDYTVPRYLRPIAYAGFALGALGLIIGLLLPGGLYLALPGVIVGGVAVAREQLHNRENDQAARQRLDRYAREIANQSRSAAADLEASTRSTGIAEEHTAWLRARLSAQGNA